MELNKTAKTAVPGGPVPTWPISPPPPPPPAPHHPVPETPPSSTLSEAALPPPLPFRSTTSAAAQSPVHYNGGTIVATARLLLPHTLLFGGCAPPRCSEHRFGYSVFSPAGCLPMNLLPPSPWPGENSPNIHPSISFQTYGHTCPAAGASLLM